jgi:hypothetical protein
VALAELALSADGAQDDALAGAVVRLLEDAAPDVRNEASSTLLALTESDDPWLFSTVPCPLGNSPLRSSSEECLIPLGIAQVACRLTWPSSEIRAVAAGLLLQLLPENADKNADGGGVAGGDSFAAGSGLLRLASAHSPGGASQLAGSGGASWRSSAAAPRGGGESLLRSLSRASSFQGGASFRSSATYAAARRDPRQLEAARKILKGVQLGRVPTTADVLSVLAQVSCPARPAHRRLRLPGARGRNAVRDVSA